ncbi:hypothetical protein GCM10009682_40010 [Luedemannella flava]|uniref:Uncharacterized protein n=1 Tax=Luedemannella flava TaxID=349316 RepID=A0ABP4YKZ1_9ACTN
MPAGAAAAAPTTVPARTSAYVAPVEQAPTVHLRSQGWVYKGFYRRHVTCEARADWYRERHIQARCRPVYVEGARQPIGYNLYVRTRWFRHR